MLPCCGINEYLANVFHLDCIQNLSYPLVGYLPIFVGAIPLILCKSFITSEGFKHPATVLQDLPDK